ncbi:MAG TPA: hypothetical protein VF257_02555 [Solirubrobacteraceae bacterium]
MSKRAMPFLIGAAVALLAPAAVAAKPPTHPDLWATVNVCDTPTRPGGVGVRVSIPRERGAPQQWARIHLQWFDATKLAWRAVPSGGDAGWTRIGIGRRLVEGGTTFTFAPPAVGMRIVLRGVVDIEWRDGKDVVDRARVRTTDGHAVAADVHRRVSRSSCEIKR